MRIIKTLLFRKRRKKMLTSPVAVLWHKDEGVSIIGSKDTERDILYLWDVYGERIAEAKGNQVQLEVEGTVYLLMLDTKRKGGSRYILLKQVAIG